MPHYDPEIRNQRREATELPLFAQQDRTISSGMAKYESIIGIKEQISSGDDRCQATGLASRQNDREIHPLASKAQLEGCDDGNGHLALTGTSSFPSQAQVSSATRQTAPADSPAGRREAVYTPGTASRSEVARARRTDPQTSHDVARKVTNIGPVREAIKEIFREHGPLIDEDLIEIYHVREKTRGYKLATDQSIRTRRKELTEERFNFAVEACGAEQNKLGNDCTLWRLRK